MRLTTETPHLDQIPRIVLFSIAAILIVLAIYTRINDLGEKSFFIDELYHVNAAKSLNSDQTLSLPSGNQYPVAQIYTRFVSLTFKYFGVSETSARLPSAIFGLSYLLFLFFFVAHIFDKTTALFTTFLLIISPLQIYYSRECRMYSLLQLTYLLQIFLFLKIIVQSNNTTFRLPFLSNTSIRSKTILLFSLLVTFYVSLHLHSVSLLFLASLLFIFPLLRAETYFKQKKGYPIIVLFTVTTCFLIFTLTCFFSTNFIDVLYKRFLFLPVWAKWTAGNYLYYPHILKSESFLLLLFIPIGFVIGTYRNYAVTCSIALFFAIPFIIQSFIPPKAARYIYHIFPLYVIFISLCLSHLINNTFVRYKNGGITRSTIVTFSFLILGTSLLVITFFYTFNNPKSYLAPKPHWRAACSAIENMIKQDDIVITDNPIAVYYYLGITDYVVDENLLQISMEAMHKDSEGRWLDDYAPAVHLTSVREITDLATRGRTIWVLFGHPPSGFPEIKEFVRRNARPLSTVPLNHGVEVFRFN
jgi:hypothetical protein